MVVLKRLVFLAAVLTALTGIQLTAADRSEAVSGATARFVAGFEGFLPCVYADPAGHATIGYGHLIHLGRPTRKDRRKWGCLTRREGLRLLRQDLKATEREVRSRIRGARTTPAMITALTSFAFNLGAGALDRQRHRGSHRITSIAARIRRGRYRLAGREMLLYNGAIIGGKRRVLPGLVIRRRKEYRLLMRGVRQLNRRCNNNCGPGKQGGVRPPDGNGSGGIAVN